MIFTRLLFSSAALIGLSGCGANSNLNHQQLPLPADWKNAAHFPVASPAKDLSRWWSRFNDPTLSRIISQSLQTSPDLASAAARIRESRARRNSEAASLYPNLSGSASG